MLTKNWSTHKYVVRLSRCFLGHTLSLAMDFSRESALRRHHFAMRRSIKVGNLLPHLLRDEGGFLTEKENATVRDESDNVKQVDELIKVLLTKEDGDFEFFCNILEKHGYKSWSEKLKETAGSYKRCRKGRVLSILGTAQADACKSIGSAGRLDTNTAANHGIDDRCYGTFYPPNFLSPRIK